MDGITRRGMRLTPPGRSADLTSKSRHGPTAIELSPAARAVGPAEPGTATRHLTQVDLARRWRMSERTLERWRWLRQGPRYIKLGSRVAYRLEDVEAFEAARARE